MVNNEHFTIGTRLRTAPPPLLPILRTTAQAEILTALFLDPTREWTITALAKQVGQSPMTASREVSIAEKAGLVLTRQLGRSRLVTANTSSPYHEPLARLLMIAFGPRQVLADGLAPIPDIAAAYLFGSWAERYLGVDGPSPNDVDVLVIGEPNRQAVYEAVDTAEGKLGRPVQVTFRTREEWATKKDPFVETVRSRSLVPLFVAHDAETVK